MRSALCRRLRGDEARDVERFMASPFPGMDPYLETEFDSGDFRHTFVVALSEALNATLPSQYASRIRERIYLVDPDFMFTPGERERIRSARAARGGVRPRNRVANTRFLDPHKELFLEVLNVRSHDVVTVVEA